MHRRWLAGLRFEQPAHHIVLEDCMATIEAATARRDRLTAQIETMLADWALTPVVHALQALRGMALVTAATVIAELGDITRFENPRQLMAYLGLVPSEHSSGGTRRQGGITKAGNGTARRMLIEAAWSYRFPARISREQLLRQEGAAQADPRYGMEGSGTTVWPLPQTHQSRQAGHHCDHGDRSRTGRLCLGYCGSSATADELTASKRTSADKGGANKLSLLRLGKAGGTVTAGEPSLPLSAGYIPTLLSRQRKLRDASGPAVTNPRIRA